MAWPDRLGVAAFVLGALVGAYLVGVNAPPHAWIKALYLGAFIGAPLWVIARVIDFVFGGPQRRRATRI